MRRGSAVVIGAVLALVAGCGGQNADPAPVVSSAPIAEIRIGLTEWSIHTGGATAASGDVELVVTNAGGTVHDLVIEGERGSWRTPMIDPGGRTTLEIETAPGETLTLICSVPGHHENGMHSTLNVAAASDE